MTMKKWLFPVLAAALLLSACAAPAGQTAELDRAALGDTLLHSGLFAADLDPIDGEMAGMLYGIDTAQEAVLYVGSGATADELALFAFADGDAAQAAVSLAQERVADQRESFSTYIPAEVEKLDRAVILPYGRYLVVCVSAGSEAEEVIRSAIDQQAK